MKAAVNGLRPNFVQVGDDVFNLDHVQRIQRRAGTITLFWNDGTCSRVSSEAGAPILDAVNWKSPRRDSK